MANLYWVGGTGNANTSSTANWSTSSGGASGAGPPTSTSNLIFNASSGSGTCTVSTAITCASINMTGSSVTFAGSQVITIAGYDASNNSLTLGGTVTYTGTFTFTDTSGNPNTITPAVTTGNYGLTFNGIGGSWTLQAGVGSASVAHALVLTSGSLNINGQTCYFSSVASSTTNTRTITLGAATIYLTTNQGWNTSGSGLTVSAASATLVGSATASFTFTGGGNSYGTLTWSPSGSGLNWTIVDSNTVGTFNFTPTSAATNPVLELTAGITLTVTGTATFTGGNNGLARAYVMSSSQTSTAAISAAVTSITSAVFRSIAASGAALWIGTSVGDMGQNSGITFDVATTYYWMAVSGGNWSATTSWAIISGGATGHGPPNPQDSVVINVNSITSTGKTITIDMLCAGTNVDCTGVLNAPKLAAGQTGTFPELGVACAIILGNLTVGASMTTITGTAAILGNYVGSSGLTSATAAFIYMCGTSSATQQLTMGSTATSIVLYIQCPGGTTQLQDALQITGTVTLTFGTWDTNSQTVSVGAFLSSNVNTRAIINPPATWYLTSTGLVFNVGTTTGLTATWPTTINHTNSSATACTWTGNVNCPVPSTTTIKRSAGSGSLTITTGYFGSVDLTGYSGTTVTGTAYLTGDWTGVSSLTSATTLTLNMIAASGTQNLTMGSTATHITLNEPSGAGTTVLQDTFTSTIAITINAGTLNTNGQTVTVPSLTINTTTACTLTLGTSNIILNSTGTILNNSGTAADVTVNNTSGSFTISDTSASTKTLALGAAAISWGSIVITGPSAGAIILQGGTVSFAAGPTLSLTITNPVCTLQFTKSDYFNISSLTINGTAGNLNVINTNTAGTAAKINALNQLTCNYISVKDNIVSGVTPAIAGLNSTLVSNFSGWVSTTVSFLFKPTVTVSTFKKKTNYISKNNITTLHSIIQEALKNMILKASIKLNAVQKNIQKIPFNFLATIQSFLTTLKIPAGGGIQLVNLLNNVAATVKAQKLVVTLTQFTSTAKQLIAKTIKTIFKVSVAITDKISKLLNIHQHFKVTATQQLKKSLSWLSRFSVTSSNLIKKSLSVLWYFAATASNRVKKTPTNLLHFAATITNQLKKTIGELVVFSVKIVIKAQKLVVTLTQFTTTAKELIAKIVKTIFKVSVAITDKISKLLNIHQHFSLISTNLVKKLIQKIKGFLVWLFY